jgi:hypothetical protein
MILSSIEFKVGLFIAIFLFYFIFSNLLVSFGKMLLGKNIISYFSFLNRYIIESFSFFLGVLISSLFIIFFSYFIGLKFSFYLFILLLIAVLVIRGKLLKSFYLDYKKILIILFIVFLQVVIALIPLPSFFASLSLEYLNPFDGFGAIVHSLRSGNISLYLLESNSVPRLNQNIGQSLITTYPMFIFGKYAQINLIVWKVFVVYNVLSLIYGLLINFTSDLRLIFVVLIGIFFGQTGLGFTYIQTLDTGSTLFFLANTDTYVCIFTFFLFYIIALYDIKVPNIFTKILLVFISISWNFFGSQNILLALVIFFGFLIFYKKINFWFCFAFLTTSLCLGYMFGGLFAVDTKFPSSSIPGLMSLANDSNLLEFRYPILSSYSHFEFYTVIDKLIPNLQTISYYNILMILIHSFFSVLIGLVFIYYLIKILKKRNKEDELYFLYIFLIITFIGLTFSSSLKIYGQVWELSRFYYIGNYFIIFSMSFVFLNKYYLNSKSRNFIKILYIFTFIPVLYYSIFFMTNNLNGSYISLHENYSSKEMSILSLSDRFDCLFRFNSEVGNGLK